MLNALNIKFNLKIKSKCSLPNNIISEYTKLIFKGLGEKADKSF